MSEYTLGQRVRFTHQLARAKVVLRHIAVTEMYGGRPVEHQRPINKEWLPISYPAPVEGIVVGKRTLSNGHSYWETDDESWGDSGYWQWDLAESFTAWLVVKDLRSKPVHVLPEHITALDA